MNLLLPLLCLVGGLADMEKQVKQLTEHPYVEVNQVAAPIFNKIYRLRNFDKWYSADRSQIIEAKCIDYTKKDNQYFVLIERKDGKQFNVSIKQFDFNKRVYIIETIKQADEFLNNVNKYIKQHEDLDEKLKQEEIEKLKWEEYKKSPEYQARFKLHQQAMENMQRLILQGNRNPYLQRTISKLLLICYCQFEGDLPNVHSLIHNLTSKELEYIALLVGRIDTDVSNATKISTVWACGNLLVQEKVEVYKLWIDAMNGYNDAMNKQKDNAQIKKKNIRKIKNSLYTIEYEDK